MWVVLHANIDEMVFKTRVLFHSSLILQDAAAQGCPVGVPGLRYVDNWRSWKAEEGDVQVQVKGEEEN